MRKSLIEDAISTFLDNVFDIATIIIAIYLIVKYQVNPPGAPLDQISELISAVLVVLGLLAASGLWDRNRRLNRVEKLIKEDHKLIETHFVAKPSAEQFFLQSVEDVRSVTSQLMDTSTTSIWLSGITLRGTIRTYQNLIEQKLIGGARVRVMIVSPNDEALLDELTRRSGRGDREFWRNCLRMTEANVNDMAHCCTKEGQLEFGYLPFMPSFGIIMMDSNTSKGIALIEMYHHDKAIQNATFELNAQKDIRWFQEFRTQYEILWTNCERKQPSKPLVSTYTNG
jgi:hypothetical protein